MTDLLGVKFGVFLGIFFKTTCKELFPSHVIATACLSHVHNGRISEGEKTSEEFFSSI